MKSNKIIAGLFALMLGSVMASMAGASQIVAVKGPLPIVDPSGLNTKNVRMMPAPAVRILPCVQVKSSVAQGLNSSQGMCVCQKDPFAASLTCLPLMPEPPQKPFAPIVPVKF